MLFVLKAPILGHVGDGNFHAFIVVDMDDPLDYKKGRDLANRIAEYYRFLYILMGNIYCYILFYFCRRALALEGTCTGEHGKYTFYRNSHTN